MDWGMSDALLAVGPMQRLLIESLRQLLVKCVAASEPKPLAEIVSGDSEAEYVCPTQFGKFFGVFRSEFGRAQHRQQLIPKQRGAAALCVRSGCVETRVYIVMRTGVLFCQPDFAARAGDVERPISTCRGPCELVPIDLSHWGALEQRSRRNVPQVVAWSDADDLLSWHVPNIEGVNVVNLYSKNAFHWFGLFEDPIAAHDKYASNKTVLKALMCPKERAHKGKCWGE